MQHTGDGQSIIGGCNTVATANISTTAEILQWIPDLEISDDIQRLRFEKLLVNIAINPLTAIHNIKNGQLRDLEYQPIIRQLLSEACTVGTAEGFNITLEQAMARAYQVMELTAQNYSSMHQDITHHRPTEIMAICGYICAQGETYGISTPVNDAMRKKILSM